MDAPSFDRWVKVLAATGRRRGVLGWLSTLPMTGGLAILLAEDEGASAKGKRRRHKKPHHHRKHSGNRSGKRKKRQHKACKAQSIAETCAGNCGRIKNNCKKLVDCGPCDCEPSCGTCETCTSALICEPCEPCCNDRCCAEASAVCHAETGACCMPDSNARTCDGQCGDVANNCGVTVDCGPCICAGGCPACQVCDEETGDCVADPNQQGERCGEDGQVCQSDGVCRCEATSCPECTVCNGTGQCASCASLEQVCCSGACVEGVCCAGSECLSAGAPDCVGHDCVCAANDDDPCTGGKTCCDDGCTNTNTDANHCGDCGTACGTGQTCEGGACGIDCDGSFCPIAEHFCENGACLACDVCATCTHTTVQAAINAASSGDTIVICAGAFTGNVTINKDLALIGAGEGSAPASNTILDAQGSGSVIQVAAGVTATLQWLRISGGAGDGGGIRNNGNLTVNACTVAGNTAPFNGASGGGIWNHIGATLTMASCTVTDNHAANQNGFGGGIYNRFGTVTLDSGTSVILNSAGNNGGGIYNYHGTLTLNRGASVKQNSAALRAGGINNDLGTVTLGDGILICDNEAPQDTPSNCVGFSAPMGVCGACPA